jgi:hypothetical protein
MHAVRAFVLATLSSVSAFACAEAPVASDAASAEQEVTSSSSDAGDASDAGQAPDACDGSSVATEDAGGRWAECSGDDDCAVDHRCTTAEPGSTTGFCSDGALGMPCYRVGTSRTEPSIFCLTATSTCYVGSCL